MPSIKLHKFGPEYFDRSLVSICSQSHSVAVPGLFTTQSTRSAMYKPKKEMDDEMYNCKDKQLEKMRKTDCFKPVGAFEGTTERSGPRERPVEFEKDEKTKDDIFGLDKF